MIDNKEIAKSIECIAKQCMGGELAQAMENNTSNEEFVTGGITQLISNIKEQI